MILNFAGRLDSDAFADTVAHAGDVVAGLVARSEVYDAWTRESACAGMSVGGLCRHLIDQVVYVATLLPPDAARDPDAPTLDLLEHYARAAWIQQDLDGEANRFVREKGDRLAGEGYDAAQAVLAEARAGLGPALASAPPTTYLPWQGWSLDTTDFVVTRLMEMVVHADDLAASLDLPTPEFGPDVLDPVLGLLAALAVRRHGEAAVVRTLTRPQRAPSTVAAF